MGMNKAERTFPTTGTRKVLVILVGYSDVAMNAASTQAFYSNLFNGGGTTALTWKKYYEDMSNNQLHLEFTIVGPYSASNMLAYYGTNVSGNDRYPGTLVGEAIDAADADGVDFAPFDNDGDGKVDNVVLIHAGQGEESGADANTIWSHRWTLDAAEYYGDGSGHRTCDGKIVNDYTIQPEYVFAAGDTTIGVFAHEFGHILGLPDLYDTTYVTDGVGRWSLMAAGSWNGSNGDVPAPLLAWERARLGWIATPDIRVARAFNSESRRMSSISVVAGVLFLCWVLSIAMKRMGLGTSRRKTALAIASLFFLTATIYLGCGENPKKNSGSSDATIDATLGDIDTSYRAIKIPLGDSFKEQYYLLENKFNKANTWSEYLPGSGLLITRIDDFVINEALPTNEVNSNYFGYPEVNGLTIIEADANAELMTGGAPQGQDTDPFFAGNNGRLTPESFPSTSYNKYNSNHTTVLIGGGTADINITEISAPGAEMSFTYE